MEWNVQDISSLTWPEDYPFPSSLDGRGRDFKYVLEFDYAEYIVT